MFILRNIVMGSLFSRTQNNSRTQSNELHRAMMTDWRNVRLEFGVTGSSGAGKSTFINAIRGLRDNDEGAARVNIIEETIRPNPYPFPDNPRVILWDLPGFGGLRHTDIEEYTVQLRSYAALLIFTRGRITRHDLELANKVQSMGKPFFFIRAHVHTECENALRSRGLFGSNNEEDINAATIFVEQRLNEIRRVCFQNVGHLLNCERDHVFLIDNYKRALYDFDRLVSAIGDVLPELSREAFVFSILATRGTLKRKAKLLKVRASIAAGATAATSFIPFPGVGAALDLALILHEITDYPKIFCLPEVNSDRFGLLSEEFRRRMLRYSFATTLQLATSLTAAGLAAELGQEVTKYIPVAGTIISCSISLAFTTNYLYRCIDDLEDVALQILERSASQLTSSSMFQTQTSIV